MLGILKKFKNIFLLDASEKYLTSIVLQREETIKYFWLTKKCLTCLFKCLTNYVWSQCQGISLVSNRSLAIAESHWVSLKFWKYTFLAVVENAVFIATTVEVAEFSNLSRWLWQLCFQRSEVNFAVASLSCVSLSQRHPATPKNHVTYMSLDIFIK